PSQFIARAEESGLIIPLGTWVLQEACRQAHRYRLEHPRTAGLRVSVNLSPRQLAQADLSDTVSDALGESGLPASALCLEITEGAVMEQPERAIETLYELRDLGVQIAIDDFGTGYSSLAYLKRFPIN